nr:GtrA family protein [Tomitella gaofuii]
MAYVDTVMGMIPQPFRDLALRHAEFIKFAIVGGTTFVVDLAIFYCLKLTILEPKPLTAKVVSGVLAMLLSYYLNRQWSFRSRGGRHISSEAVLFFVVSGIGVVLSFLPLWASRYGLHLNAERYSLTVENIADFVSAYVIGNLLQMAFRFWAMRRWVFPHEDETTEVDVSKRPGSGPPDLPEPRLTPRG